MTQVTENTQIDTINILTEASSANDTDMFLLQRGSTSYKLAKSNLKLNSNQLQNLSDYVAIGNISGGGDSEEISILKYPDNGSNLDNALVTEKRIKDYISSINTKPSYVELTGGTIDLEHYSSLTSTKTYNIADFTGSGLNTNNIIGVYVEAYAFGEDGHEVYIQATFPSGTYHKIIESHGYNGDDDCGNGGIIYIPINDGQTSISFISNSSGNNTAARRTGFSLKGVLQV
jgi:hypothetical protein